MAKQLLRFAAALAVTLTCAATAAAQTADEIVAKNLAAKGGVEKLKGVQTLRQSGTMTLQGQTAQFTAISKRPNLNRQEITIQGTTIQMIFDGTKAWMVNPMMGPSPMEMPAEQSDMVKDQSDIDGPLVDYKSKGSTIDYVGTETVDGKKAYHLRVTRKGLPPQELYIDTTTNLEIKAVTTIPGSGTMELAFGDYRSVDGLMVPFSVTSTAGGMVVSELKLDKVEFNVPLPPDTFKIK